MIKECYWCGKSHTVRKADLKRGWGKFCSKSCKAKEQAKRIGIPFLNDDYRDLGGIIVDPVINDHDLDYDAWGEPFAENSE